MENNSTPPTTESQLGPQLDTQLTPPIITIKEEEEYSDDVEEVFPVFDHNNSGGVSFSMSKIEENEEDDEEEEGFVPKPFEKLNELGGTPPFLRKTYEMVENPETDEILSWGCNGVSFVVWDPYKFSTDLLPKFFKHSNFSSFVRQLNTYGFRKVHFDQWEFANAAFQRDKKHLLKSIKRRRHGSVNNNSSFKFRRETDIENLKLEQEALKVEIHDLKNQQVSSNQSLAAMEERIKCTEFKHTELLLFLAKSMKNTSLFQQLFQKYKQKKSLENERVFKRRRLASGESLNDTVSKDDLVGIKSEANSFLETSPPITGLGTRSSLTSETETSSPDLSSGNYIMWEKLMEDDVICADHEEVFDDNQTKFVHELEDLMGKPLTWANVGEVACPGGQ
ncbi:hypothetical protein RND81_08G024200 [Saponaria officinalis]|uniref:HSF-type DNA-binding domain-containing protein n=1 Tax=Saponaria officinalis TaxID=3572 RepID=A0AAW1J4K9_SAPOF